MRLFIAFIAFIAFVPLSVPADAQESAHAAQTSSQAGTRIEIDQEAGVIRFIVNGKEQARIDETGLHVREDLNFGGMINDVGEAGYAAAAPKSDKP